MVVDVFDLLEPADAHLNPSNLTNRGTPRPLCSPAGEYDLLGALHSVMVKEATK